MNKLILAIEKMQSDHEDSRLKSDISLNISENYFMTLNKSSNSIYSSKVLYAHTSKNMDSYKIYDEAEAFYGKKKFSWYLDLDKDKNMKNLLEAKGWFVIDEYDGRYLSVNDIEDIETKNIVEVKANSQEVRDLVKITSHIWHTVEEDKVELSINKYNEYLNAQDRRGGYILYYDDEKAVGYASYRFSKSGEYMYLSGTGVLESYRRKGVYRNLLNYRMKLAKENKVEYVITQARKGHSSPILEKCSFKKAGEFAFLIKNDIE